MCIYSYIYGIMGFIWLSQTSLVLVIPLPTPSAVILNVYPPKFKRKYLKVNKGTETKETVKAVISGTPKEKDDNCDHIK